jgi:hypothetical protein
MVLAKFLMHRACTRPLRAHLPQYLAPQAAPAYPVSSILRPTTRTAVGYEMSPLGLGVTPIAFSLFFSVFAVAQISAPNCTDTSYAWVWMSWFRRYLLWPLSNLVNHYVQAFNSVGQSPCTVIAYMMGSCDGGSEVFNCLHDVLPLRSYLICRIRTFSTTTGIQVLWSPRT